MNDEARAWAVVCALLFGAGNVSGFAGGRITAPLPAPQPAPPAEIRFVEVPAWAVPVLQPVLAPPQVETVPVEVVEPAAPAEPPAAVSAPAADVKPAPKVEPKPKPKPKPEPQVKKPRPAAPPKKPMPSCAAIKREYERMSFTERMAAYRRADAEQIAHGRRCLGM